MYPAGHLQGCNEKVRDSASSTDICVHLLTPLSLCSSTQAADPGGLYRQPPLLSGFQYGLLNGGQCQGIGGQEENEVEVFLPSVPALGLQWLGCLPSCWAPLPQQQPQLSPGSRISISSGFLVLEWKGFLLLLHAPPPAPDPQGLHHPLLLSSSVEVNILCLNSRLPHEMHPLFPAKTLMTHF